MKKTFEIVHCVKLHFLLKGLQEPTLNFRHLYDDDIAYSLALKVSSTNYSFSLLSMKITPLFTNKMTVKRYLDNRINAHDLCTVQICLGLQS